MNKYIHQVVFQSKAPNKKWEDVKIFKSNSDFILPPIEKMEIERMKREYEQDLIHFKTRTVNRIILNK
jgi:hypothetical protein